MSCSASSIVEASALRTSSREGTSFSTPRPPLSPESHSVGVKAFCLGVGGRAGDTYNLEAEEREGGRLSYAL